MKREEEKKKSDVNFRPKLKSKEEIKMEIKANIGERSQEHPLHQSNQSASSDKEDAEEETKSSCKQDDAYERDDKSLKRKQAEKKARKGKNKGKEDEINKSPLLACPDRLEKNSQSPLAS